jgi:hypothetical protein
LISAGVGVAGAGVCVMPAPGGRVDFDFIIRAFRRWGFGSSFLFPLCFHFRYFSVLLLLEPVLHGLSGVAGLGWDGTVNLNYYYLGPGGRLFKVLPIRVDG